MKCKDNEYCECDGEGVCRNSMKTTPQEEKERLERRAKQELVEMLDTYLVGSTFTSQNVMRIKGAIEFLIKSEKEKSRQEVLREVREKIESSLVLKEVSPISEVKFALDEVKDILSTLESKE